MGWGATPSSLPTRTLNLSLSTRGPGLKTRMYIQQVAQSKQMTSSFLRALFPYISDQHNNKQFRVCIDPNEEAAIQKIRAITIIFTLYFN